MCDNKNKSALQAIEDAAVWCLRSNVSFPENNASSKTHTAMQTEALSRLIQFIAELRARSTIAEKILVTHRCEKIWFYSHDVINGPSVRPSAPTCKSYVKRRTVTSLQAQSFGGKARLQVERYSQSTRFYSHSVLAKEQKICRQQKQRQVLSSLNMPPSFS